MDIDRQCMHLVDQHTFVSISNKNARHINGQDQTMYAATCSAFTQQLAAYTGHQTHPTNPFPSAGKLGYTSAAASD